MTYRFAGQREINTGHGFVLTRATHAEIAERRSQRIESPFERHLFMDTYGRYREVALSLAHKPMDLETVCTELTKHSAAMEAAMIEALASLRAEGHQL